MRRPQHGTDIQVMTNHQFLHPGIAEHAFRRPVGDDLAAVKGHQARHVAGHDLHVMFDEEYRDTM